MNTWLIKLITFLFALSLESCDFEGKYVHVCEGNYGSENVIDSIVQRYNFTNVHFAQSYKDYATPKTSNCDTINLVIQSDNSPVFYNDTLAISVAKIFFYDSLNKKVKFLNIEVLDCEPAIGMTKINFLVGREHLDKNYETIMIPNNKKMEYEIIEEHKYTQYPSRENYTGIEVIVSVKEDYNDCKNIAAYIKAQYDKTIQKDKLSQFRIKLIIKLPASKLCTNKSYHLFYDQKNNNM